MWISVLVYNKSYEIVSSLYSESFHHDLTIYEAIFEIKATAMWIGGFKNAIWAYRVASQELGLHVILEISFEINK